MPPSLTAPPPPPPLSPDPPPPPPPPFSPDPPPPQPPAASATATAAAIVKSLRALIRHPPSGFPPQRGCDGPAQAAACDPPCRRCTRRSPRQRAPATCAPSRPSPPSHRRSRP